MSLIQSYEFFFWDIDWKSEKIHKINIPASMIMLLGDSD